MTKEREALKLALEALELAGGNLCEALHHPKKLQHGIGQPCPAVAKYEKAITAIKEALAQPEQEPFEYWNAVEGWVKIDEVREHFGSVGCGTIYKTAGEDRVPVYTTSPKREWQGLTDTEIQAIHDTYYRRMGPQEFARAIESKLKEKNT
jgi:hypothetical protein